MDSLDDDDRRMLAELNARARQNRMRTLLQWALILVPGIPLVLAGIFMFGILVGGPAAVGAVVGWAIVVQKLIPVRDIV